jgi:hypothetical protein
VSGSASRTCTRRCCSRCPLARWPDARSWEAQRTLGFVVRTESRSSPSNPCLSFSPFFDRITPAPLRQLRRSLALAPVSCHDGRVEPGTRSHRMHESDGEAAKSGSLIPRRLKSVGTEIIGFPSEDDAIWADEVTSMLFVGHLGDPELRERALRVLAMTRVEETRELVLRKIQERWSTQPWAKEIDARLRSRWSRTVNPEIHSMFDMPSEIADESDRQAPERVDVRSDLRAFDLVDPVPTHSGSGRERCRVLLLLAKQTLQVARDKITRRLMRHRLRHARRRSTSVVPSCRLEPKKTASAAGDAISCRLEPTSVRADGAYGPSVRADETGPDRRLEPTSRRSRRLEPTSATIGYGG